VDVKFVEIFV